MDSEWELLNLNSRVSIRIIQNPDNPHSLRSFHSNFDAQKIRAEMLEANRLEEEAEKERTDLE